MAVLFFFALLVVFEAAVIGTQALLHMPGFSGYARALVVAALLPLPLWLTLVNLTCAPLLRVVGALTYYSPMLLVTKSSRHRVYIHGATLSDYVICMGWQERGSKARHKVLSYYLEGLLRLIQDVESGYVPGTALITGTSYFFSTKRARALGFRVEESWRLAFGGLLTYPAHFLTYSYAKGRWTLPNVFHAKRASITGAGLLKQKDKLEALLNRLRNSNNITLSRAYA